MRAAAVVLAAGGSARLGRPKQLLPLRGVPLVRAIAVEACASACTHVAVVVRRGDSQVEACLHGLRVEILANDGWAEGLASSIRLGAAWAMQCPSDVVALLVCDQPALTAAHVDRLLAAWRPGVRVVASSYAGVLGVPAIFARETFASLLELHGDSGAQRLVRSEEAVITVDWPDGALDVDVAADVARLDRT
jgi:xanthine dehydrogenase accessory factor